MSEKELEEIILFLKQIKEDSTIPKNIKEKIGQAISTLSKGDSETSIKISKALENLDSIPEDPNTPTYTRLEVLNIIGTLGSQV
ncbi:MAG TPA: UPF0147 family protein [Candidatus Nanoarchaeia archaeon]|nr:UPF0147 family protein [Candidatus Nanoarchaeia archaeon]